MQIISKRKRFVLASILLSIGFLGIQALPEAFRFVSIGILGVFTVIFFILSLWEGLSRDLTLLTLILPFFYTTSIGFFWFLLPSNILARLPVVILYGIGIYSLNLTLNIYTVSAIRTIALLRAARGVGFVLTLFTQFLIYDSLLSVRLTPFVTLPLIFFISMPIFLQGFWSTTLDKKLNKSLLLITLISSLTVTQIALCLFFWPVSVAVGSLFLTLTSYVLLGLGQSSLEGRLFSETVREYMVVALVVFLGMYFLTNWN